MIGSLLQSLRQLKILNKNSNTHYKSYSVMGILWKVSRFTVRVSLFAGAVKLSIDNDIWSLKTDKGSDLYAKFKKYILPGTIVFAEKLPSAQEVQFKIGRYWNCGVNKAFNAIENAPSSFNTLANRLINSK